MEKFKFFKNTLFYFLIKILIILSWFIITIFSTRFLPIADFGKFIIYNTTITLLTTFSTTYVSNSILRLYPQYKKSVMLASFLSNMFYYILFTTSLVIILILFCNFVYPKFINKILPFNILFIITPLIIINIYNYFLSIYRAVGNVLLYSFFNFWQLIVSFCLGFILYKLNHNNTNYYYFGYIGALLLFSPIILINFKDILYNLFDYKLNFHFANELFNYGLPILIIGTSSLLLSSLDRYFIIYLLDLNKSTLYSVSYTISEQSILVITGLISITSVPYLFNLYESKGIEQAKLFQEKILKFYLFLTIPIVIVLAFFYNEILNFLLSSKYQNGFFILPYISAGAFFIGLSNVFSDVYTLKKKTKTLMIIYSSSLLANVFLNYILIIKYDILGAAIATLTSYILLFLLTFKFSRTLIRIDILYSDLIKLFFSVLLLVIFCYLIKNIIIITTIYNLILYLIMTFLLYIIAIFSFKFYDLKIIYNAITNIKLF